VIYTGTFSKVMFPALRVGYVVVPKDLVEIFTSVRTLIDLRTPTVQLAARCYSRRMGIHRGP
jgi:GntR family transcriptional regulator/MocR family aminotransferase